MKALKTFDNEKRKFRKVFYKNEKFTKFPLKQKISKIFIKTFKIKFLQKRKIFEKKN